MTLPTVLDLTSHITQAAVPDLRLAGIFARQWYLEAHFP